MARVIKTDKSRRWSRLMLVLAVILTFMLILLAVDVQCAKSFLGEYAKDRFHYGYRNLAEAQEKRESYYSAYFKNLIDESGNTQEVHQYMKEYQEEYELTSYHVQLVKWSFHGGIYNLQSHVLIDSLNLQQPDNSVTEWNCTLVRDGFFQYKIEMIENVDAHAH